MDMFPLLLEGKKLKIPNYLEYLNMGSGKALKNKQIQIIDSDIEVEDDIKPKGK